jgi:hypothetical protein
VEDKELEVIGPKIDQALSEAIGQLKRDGIDSMLIAAIMVSKAVFPVVHEYGSEMAGEMLHDWVEGALKCERERHARGLGPGPFPECAEDTRH